MIYLASPYTHDDPVVRYQRYRLALECVAHFMTERHLAIFAPIAYGHPHAHRSRALRAWTHEEWLAWSGHFLEVATALWVLTLAGWRESVGIRTELETAMRRGIVIRYIDYDERHGFSVPTPQPLDEVPVTIKGRAGVMIQPKPLGDEPG